MHALAEKVELERRMLHPGRRDPHRLDDTSKVFANDPVYSSVLHFLRKARGLWLIYSIELPVWRSRPDLLIKRDRAWERISALMPILYNLQSTLW